MPGKYRLKFTIDASKDAQIDKRVAEIKKYRPDYSKEEWFIEAFVAKLDREEEKFMQMLESLKAKR